jgi:hypothetical protein
MKSPAPLALASLLLLSIADSRAADSRAVDAANFNLGFDSRQIDTTHANSSGTVDLNAYLNFPLTFLGASISGTYGHSNVEATHDVIGSGTTAAGTVFPCSLSRTDLAGTLFARNSVGRIGLSYDSGHLSSNCGDGAQFLPSSSDTLGTHSYTADAELYISRVTLAGARTRTRLENGSNSDTNTFGVNWYAFDNLRLGLSTNDLYSSTTYGFSVATQPEFLGNALSVALGFATTRETPSVRTYTFGLAYHFGRQVDLITRDRHY